MSFESKRLRVQLPCPEGESVKELDFPELRCQLPSFFCAPDTCVAGPDSQIGPRGVCLVPSRVPPECLAGTEEAFQPGRILIDPEVLPVLREQLEAQLKEIEKAEEELRKRTA